MSKVATALVIVAILVGVGVGLVLSRLTEVQCPAPLNHGACFEGYRFSTSESAGLGVLAAVAVGLAVDILRRTRSRRSG